MRVVTIAIIGIMILIYVTPFNMHDFGSIVIDAPARTFYHANWEHLIANSISFFALSFMEQKMGSLKYLMAIIFIWAVSTLILYGIFWLFPSRRAYTVGFSGVIFGLSVLYFTMMGSSPGISALGLAVTLVPQLFVPGISWEGHLAGILAGVLYVICFPIKERITRDGNGKLS